MRRSSSRGWGWTVLLVLPGIAAVGGVGAALVVALRLLTRPPVCPMCGQPMVLLDEAADDAHLTEPQRLEERIGSVDHKVWYCERDNRVEHVASNCWFSRYRGCSSCGYRTLSSSSTVIESATYVSSGLLRVEERCVHCGHAHSYTRVIPRKERSEQAHGAAGLAIGHSFGVGRTSRSSSRSSFISSPSRRSSGFGGGRSSGRGASGRW